MLHEYNIDSYLGIQLLCCLDFKSDTPAIDPDKYRFFIGLLRPGVVKLAVAKMERLQWEVEQHDTKELLEEYCLLMPDMYRVEAYNQCKEILDLQRPLPDAGVKILQYLGTKLK